ncbi:MAG: hypothetical protein JSW55_19535 [Chloroflexota bacterium]|nr:MAG: hypothetical protein JSW55_19535 [Chloroflexota bacterium]
MISRRLRLALTATTLLLPLVLACGILGDALPPTDSAEATAEPIVVATPLTTSTATQIPPPTETALPTEEPTREPTPSPTTTAEITEVPAVAPLLHDLSIDSDDVLLLPVPAVYAGDLATLQVSPNLPRGIAPNDVQVRVLLDGQELLTDHINYRKLSGDVVGLYQWVWDTTSQEGAHTITIEIDPADLIQINDENPDNNVTSLEVVVRPRRELTANEANASWIEFEGDCCIVHVVSGTAAHRDIDRLKAEVEAAFERAANALTTPLSATPYDVYFIDRVIGQGGYALDGMVVSYLDRNYAGGELDELLVHEAVHVIDQDIAPDRIAFLAEGLAVWAAGGHYQQQDPGQRMAALIEDDGYLPLRQVIENFHTTQHELSYLESASLIDYMVKTYGWPRVRDLYANATADDGPTLTDAIDVNLRATFGRTLEQVEADWLTYLATLPRDLTAVQNLQTTIRYYDTMRRYQTLYDPTAYYLYAWLPDPGAAAERGATAFFSRHPESDTNIALESLLLAANDALLQGDYDRVNAMLGSVDRVLDNEGQFIDPLAKSYLDIVRAVAEEGYEAQRIDLDGDRAKVSAGRPNWLNTVPLQLFLGPDRTWVLIQ